MGKKSIGCFLLLLFVTCLSSCGRAKEEGRYSYDIYYVNKDATRVVYEEYVTDTSAEDMDRLLQELIAQMKDTSDRPELLVPLSDAFQSYTLIEGQMNLDFQESYLKQEPIAEVLGRAAVVRTLTQVRGIDTITFSVQGEALADVTGVPVGAMAEDSFIDNAGTEINAYVDAEFRLYFANKEGDKLTEVSRNVIYNSNISMEQQVVEELIKGPVKDGNTESEAGFPDRKSVV